MTWTPLDETAVANMAIDVIDDAPIASLDVDKPVARFMKRNFWVVQSEVLYTYPWAFARRYVHVPADATPPPFGWRYSYTLPTDCVRPWPPRYQGMHNAPPIKYELVGDQIYTDYQAPLPLIYVRREVNVAKFTPPFARVLAMTLAVYAAQNMTGKAQYLDKTLLLLNTAWEQAKLAESLTAGTPEMQNRHDIIDIRGRGMPSPVGFGAVTTIPSSTP